MSRQTISRPQELSQNSRYPLRSQVPGTSTWTPISWALHYQPPIFHLSQLLFWNGEWDQVLLCTIAPSSRCWSHSPILCARAGSVTIWWRDDARRERIVMHGTADYQQVGVRVKQDVVVTVAKQETPLDPFLYRACRSPCGMVKRSSHSKPPWITRAMSADGMAPARIVVISSRAKPSTINVP